MTKQELIKKCRYYKGQDRCPYNDNNMAWFWDMERVWVSNGGEFSGESSYYSLIDANKYKGIPFSLLMVMFTSWGKSAYNIKKEIGRFYKLIDEYLDIVYPYIPKDKIPG